MGWATLWAIFSQTHLVTLFCCPFGHPLFVVAVTRFLSFELRQFFAAVASFRENPH
jgi:hypothetical protein